jgi:diguanylate cyclase
MTGSSISTESTESTESAEASAEYLRLALSKLSQLKLPVSPVNYSLIYFYMAGKDVDLNEKLDKLFEDWDETQARQLFSSFICECDENEYQELREDLLMTVAQILGSVVCLAGKAAISNSSLEKHMQKLASSNKTKDILHIAAEIISDTRDFVEQSRQFENDLLESTQEISVLKNELDQARRMASTDALTGLHNRRGFDEAIVQAVENSQRRNDNFCLLIIDIDHFKNVNDKHGHLVGDKVLVGISQILQKQMRGRDYLSRYGGEEFSIILRETAITGAFTVAENLRKVVQKLRLKHVKTGNYLETVTISIGIANYRHGENIKEFIQRCDKALYRAKSLGRNRSVIAD